tara:strand:- start:616 stop:789 length:174 start_codon:yes stop_codon:yes gene_type:complete
MKNYFSYLEFIIDDEFYKFLQKKIKKLANTNDLVKKHDKNSAKLRLFTNTEIVENTA